MKHGIIILTAALAAMAWLVGCQQNQSTATPVNPADPPTWADGANLGRIIQSQSDSGAAEEATLYPLHFEGPALNSLGEQRIDEMLRHWQHAGPLSIYLDIPANDDAGPRRQSVGKYLSDHAGAASEQVRLLDGPNPTVAASSSEGLKTLGKTDTANDSPTAGAATGAPGGASH